MYGTVSIQKTGYVIWGS